MCNVCQYFYIVIVTNCKKFGRKKKWDRFLWQPWLKEMEASPDSTVHVYTMLIIGNLLYTINIMATRYFFQCIVLMLGFSTLKMTGSTFY